MILNLTQHAASEEQINSGVIEPENKKEIQELLTVQWGDDIKAKAAKLALIAESHGHKKALIGGAPYLMPQLEKSLIMLDVEPVYAFSNRISEEFTNEKGEVEKKMFFKHLGFYSPVINGFTE